MEASEIDYKKVCARLMAKREIDEDTDCWLFTGATTGNGYGYIWCGDGPQYAHRVAAILFLGFALEGGLWVLHRCDTPACFNPDHLFPGTPADNARDAAAKGRLRGKKLSDQQAAEIKRLLNSGRTQRSIADEFGVTSTAIGQIAREETWKHVKANPQLDASLRPLQQAA